jgi:hypothetical protein
VCVDYVSHREGLLHRGRDGVKRIDRRE